MAGTWMLAILSHRGLLDPAATLGRAALAAELRRGGIGISLGDVLVFFVTVWLAFLLSSFVRFLLEEDVFPRLRLARGVSYTISSLLHYTLLLLGFLLAIAALGLDLNKVTILAGAFGVGLGFGLQGMVNNFVSGLIVLLERPLQAGARGPLPGIRGQRAEVRAAGVDGRLRPVADDQERLERRRLRGAAGRWNGDPLPSAGGASAARLSVAPTCCDMR